MAHCENISVIHGSGYIDPVLIIHDDIDENNKGKEKPADFEKAIVETGYGKFHIFLLLAAMPAYWSIVFVSSTISFTLAGAECDLDINLMQKGYLTSITYIGMLVSGIFWGYLSDTLGRKNIISYGLIVASVIELVASGSQTYWMLLVMKFLAGFVVTGPFAILLTYISEVHSSRVRARVLLSSGVFYSMASIGLPLVAWAIIPRDLDFSFFDGSFVIHSWNIFLAVCSLPALISGIALLTLPESPKFLMSRGRNDEALETFKQIFNKNTGCPAEDYPVKELVDETINKEASQKSKGLEAFICGIKQMSEMLTRAYLPWLILLCLLNMLSMFGGNAMRLWFPQIAGMLDDYTSKHDDGAGLCEILESYSNVNVTTVNDGDYIEECVKLTTGAATYVNSVIVGCASAISYAIAGYLVNVIGKNKLLIVYCCISLICPLALPWLGVTESVAVFAIFLSTSGTNTSTLSSVIVDLFPTSIRAMAVTIFMMFARMGTISGSIAFPALLKTGCIAPFYTIAVVMLFTGCGCMLLPGTNQKKME